MDIKVIPLSELLADMPGLLAECCNSGDPVVVELPDHRLVTIQPLDVDDAGDTLIDSLIESNAEFRAMLARSKASPRKSFPPP